VCPPAGSAGLAAVGGAGFGGAAGAAGSVVAAGSPASLRVLVLRKEHSGLPLGL